MLKKGILLLMVVVVAGGLFLWDSLGGAAYGKSEKDQGFKKHNKKDLMLSVKEFADPELVLIDARDGTTLQKLKASSLKTKEDAEKMTEELEATYDRPMIPARLSNGKITPGQARVVVNKEELMKQLVNIKVFQRVLEVPITETAPNVTAETAANVDQTTIGSYTTKFDPTVTGRVSNIVLSAQTINNTILGPGDRFYFNLVVGERTSARGYQKAMEIVNKEFVEGIGGGICQTSSTLFNAIDKAGLTVLQRSYHSKQVGYVPLGRDATVSWGGPDFKFQNNKNYPVIIKIMVNRQSGTIEVQVRAAAKYVASN